MEIQTIISYGANIVFVTWGLVSLVKDYSRSKETANFFNAVYEMAERLAGSIEEGKQQAEDIASFLKSATMNFMKIKRNAIKQQRRRWLLWSREKEGEQMDNNGAPKRKKKGLS